MAFTTYDSVGQAQDVSGVISNIDPFDTPLQTLIGSESMTARLNEWQEDSLQELGFDPLIEGATFSDVDRVATVMRSNYSEIIGDAFGVSETSDAVTTHGRAKETAYQLAKSGKGLKVTREKRLFAHDAATSDAAAGINAAVGDSSSNARISGNVWGLDVGTDAIVTNRSAATTSQVTFDEDAFLAGMKVTYDAGAPGKCLMVTPNVSLMIQGWSRLTAGRTRDSMQGKKLTMMVDLLVTPFGEVKVVLNRHMTVTTAGVARTGDDLNDAVLIDPMYWKTLILRPWKKIPLAKVQDGDRYALRGEFSLKHKNYSEGYLWTNLAAPVAA